MMIWKVFPLSWLTKFLTFSKKITFGFFATINLKVSKNKSPDFSSSNPFLYPATLNDVQGNPDIKTSTSGTSLVSTLLISCSFSTASKFFLKVILAFLSYSFAQTVLNFPVNSKPKSIPPTPANRLAIL
ncbi:hypothetical protein MCAL160_0865 [Mycoplasmopsis californica HAZ160_1]|uniref:Uncharacterized protein n=1 Tax=Mycoplasmopsis californica HAZ160_1 TaxID=1397850 RepID=A0AAT9F8L0_9BACT|nr:hypothetical protein MCAL160_0865 [Mycoplasmopsis californica HAZ160_1]BBG42874.1 hypothetical protein MCAL160E_0865 [Mycoplasmopsis californica]BBG43449.1 hypothetical protein MCAL160L_0865 [Mycoplasmopsis californica]